MTSNQKGWLVVIVRAALFVGVMVLLIAGVPLFIDWRIFAPVFCIALGAIFIAPDFAKCPKCGLHVAGRFANQTSLFDIEFENLLPSETCRNCGMDLTE